MSWRTVVISRRAKLDYKMGYIVIRGEEVNKVHLSEVSMLLIETTAVSVTSALLCELIKKKVKVVFCDEKRNPSSTLLPFYGSYDTSAKVRSQVSWTKANKELVWTEIVTEKIKKQLEFLVELQHPARTTLEGYINDIEHFDVSNREGHAAKVYFNAVFGEKFSRSQDNPTNAALNYGYGVLLSTFCRAIVANGYITQLGVFHNNMFNDFNLASDLMEPFRILVDRQVYNMSMSSFEHEEKMEVLNILNKKVLIEGKQQYLNNAINIYCRSVFEALNEKNIELIRFYKNEL